MRRALTLLVALSGLLNGCTSWKTEEVAPASYITSNHPGTIRITLQDSTRLTLQSPVVVGDSIIGTVATDSVRRAVAENTVRSMEVRGTNALLTVGLLAGIAAAGFLVLGAAAVAGGATE